MKKGYIAAGIIILIAVLILLHRPGAKSTSAMPDTNTVEAATPGTTPQIPSVQPTMIDSTQQTGEKPLLSKEQRLEKRQNAIDHSKDDWRTPIEFYGLVEDESNNVVSGVQVDFQCNDVSAEGTSFYHTQSDLNGAFSITGISGKLLRVNVAKEGYYSYDHNGQFFYYAGQNQNFVPDQGHPVVFRLRQKGEGANLIHYDKTFRLPRDGSPILIDLATAQTVSASENSLKVEGWTYDNQKKEGWKYDWKCHVSVPGGGLQPYDSAFPFLAPENNYVPDDSIDMPVTNGVQWSYIVHRNYYFRTAGGKYGRMIFTMVAGGDNFCELNCVFNPDGSRNLEPKQQP